MIIKKILLFLLTFWYRRGNRIIIHKPNGKIIESFSFWGLTVKFRGKNSVVELFEPIEFNRRVFSNRSIIRIDGNNNHILIKNTNNNIRELKVGGFGSNNKFTIGENFYLSGLCFIDFCGLNNMKLTIGDNCMFGQNIEIMLGDHHTIYDKTTKECLNISKKGIEIGNHVWLARDVTILKDVTIPNYCVVGKGSIVTKQFRQENAVLVGNPAKIVKDNIDWEK